MAHFLEHLVFKGGQKYDDYRKVNQTAETMGAVLNAYTSHDLVAFHITCRAEVVTEAIDLLTDFVGRPKIDAEELDRERGVVIQEIARAHDQPSVIAEHLIDRAAFGDHPLGRPGARARRSTCATFSRDAILAFRRRQWVGSRGGAFLVGNLEHVPENSEMAELFGRFPSISANGARRAGAAVRADDAGRGARVRQSHLRMSYRPSIEPARARRARRAGRLLDAAGRLDGLAPVRRDPRAARAGVLASTRSTTRSPTCRSCSSRRAWTRPSASRPTRACARSSTSCAPTGRREEEVERARAYAAGRRVLAFENTNAVARHAAHADRRLRAGHRPRQGDRGAGRGDLRPGRRGRAAGSPTRLSVACVGPHEQAEFS